MPSLATAIPSPKRRRGARFGRRLALVLAVAGFGAVALRATVTPDAASARAFAVGLERDYSQRQSKALIDRIDEDALLQRIFQTPDPRHTYPWIKWDVTVAPALVPQLSGLNAFRALVTGRLILAGNTRVFEGQFLDANGQPELGRFTLVQNTYGSVLIADFQLAGDPLPFSQMIRQQLLLKGVHLEDLSDPEDMEIQAFGANYGKIAKQALTEINDQKFDFGYADWAKLPDDLKTKRIWWCFRDTFALNGAKAAKRDLERDIRNGDDNDPFVRYNLALTAADGPAMLAALDEILATRENPVLYRCAKANLLLQSGQALAAYRLYCDIVDLEPLTGVAYTGAMLAAVATKQPPLAIEMLHRWTLLASPAQIDATLAPLTALKTFRASTEYQAWLHPAPAAVSSPPN